MSASATKGGHKEERRRKKKNPQDENIMACPITYVGHKDRRNHSAKI